MNLEDFTLDTLAQQSSLLNQSYYKMEAVLGVKPTLFIPPYYKWDQNTLSAMEANGYTHLSSASAEDPPPYFLSGQSVYHFPGGAGTANVVVTNGIYTPVTANATWSQIQTQLGAYGFSVVMMHPMDFAVLDGTTYANQVNTTQMNELSTLLQMVKASGLRVVIIGDMNTDANDTVTTGSSTPVSTTGSVQSSTTGSPVSAATTGSNGQTTDDGDNINNNDSKNSSNNSSSKFATKWIILIAVLGGVAVLAAVIGIAMFVKSRRAAVINA
jgi:hypothetical protein